MPVAEVEQRREPLVDDEHDATAVAAVAARRARPGDELLAPERDRAVAAVAGLHVDRGFVDEVHGMRPRRVRVDAARALARGDDAGDRARAGAHVLHAAVDQREEREVAADADVRPG